MRKSDASSLHDGLVRLVDACRAIGAADPDSTLTVSETQARILRQLDRTDPTMVGELADHFGVTPSTMSLNLKRLEGAGCIRRSRDPDDRRVMNVRLTEQGRRVRDGASSLDISKIDALLRALRPAERARALEGLRLLLEGTNRVASRSQEYMQALTEGGAPDDEGT